MKTENKPHTQCNLKTDKMFQLRVKETKATASTASVRNSIEVVGRTGVEEICLQSELLE